MNVLITVVREIASRLGCRDVLPSPPGLVWMLSTGNKLLLRSLPEASEAGCLCRQMGRTLCLQHPLPLGLVRRGPGAWSV